MQWVRRVLTAGILAAALAGLVVWLMWDPLLETARRRIEPLLAEALDLPVRIGVARLNLRPLQLEIGDVSIGEAGAVLRVGSGRLTVRVGESIRRGHPVADLETSDVTVAPLGFAQRRAAEEPAGTSRALPRFSLRRVRAANVRILLPAPDAPFVLTAARLHGRVGTEADGVMRTLVRARDAMLTRGERMMPIEALRGKAEIRGSDVIIRSAFFDSPDVDLRVAYDAARRRHEVHAAANVVALDLIDPVLREINGPVVLDAHVSGTLNSAEADAHLQAPHLVVFGHEVEGVDATLRWRQNALALIRGQAKDTTGTYVAAGNLVVDDTLPFTLTADWQHLTDAATAAAGTEEAPPLSARAAAVAQGTLKPLRVTAELTGSASRSPNGDETVELTGRATLADGAVRMSASATQKRGNSLEANLSLDPAGRLDGSIRARVGHAPSWQALLGTTVTPHVQGVLTADINVAGTRDLPQLEGTVRGKDLTLFGASIRSVDAAVRGDTERVELERLLIHLTRGSLVGEGTFGVRADTPNDWRMVVEDVPTDTVAALVAAASGTAVPLWGGQVDLRVSGTGPWHTAQVQANAQVDHFYLQRQPIDRVSVGFQSAWPQWRADGHVDLGPDERLNLVASGTGADSLSVSLQSTRWDLARVQSANRSGLRGQVELSATAEGPPTALSGRVHLGGEAIEWSGRALGAVALDAEGQSGSWRLRARVGELIAASGTLETRGELPLGISAEWHDADVAPLVQPDPNVRIDSSGTLRLEIPLRAAQRLSGTLRVDRLDIRGADQAAPLLSVETPIIIVATGGRFDLRSLRLGGTGTHVAADGWFSSSGECDIGIDATSDLAVIEILSPAVYAARGSATVGGRMRCRRGAPVQLTGSAKLERVAVDLGEPWVAVNVNGQMTFADSIVTIDALTGRLAGGTFSVGGLVDVARGPQLTWSATELAPAMIPDVEAELSGNGSVRGTWSEIMVAGELEVLRALYDRRFAITDLIPLFQKQLAKPGSKEPARTRVRLDLHIVAPDELFIDNNVAKIEMRTDLRLTGTSDNLVIAGPVEVLDGEVKFRGRTFTLETGLIEFRPELGRQAYLNITAQTVVPTARASYTVDTHIVGTTDNYQVTFSSDDPSLAQTDLVSLVTFGKTAAELQQGGGGVSFSDLVALAPGLYREQAQEQAQSLLGIDRVDLEPGYSKSTGLYEPRITLGKQLRQDLTASLSSTFGTQRRQQVQLEYRVSPRISLSGDWESTSTDQAGAFGGEVKFRYPFRTFPGWAALLPWPGEDVQ